MTVHMMTAMSETLTQKSVPTVSAVLAEGILVEMVYARHENRTGFAIWTNGACQLTDSFKDDAGRRLVPYSPDNNLIESKVVLFPSEPLDYGSQTELVEEIRSYIHRYVDVSDVFELIASTYVLFTWLYDGFNELPYLRLKGDFGSGKTRFLQTVGSLCYRPIFTSGASTVSPIFHMLDRFGGTLLLDEADFRYSDEKADIIKILNNGNMRGMPVLRASMNRQREFDPRVFNVFGPKIIAMRGPFDDAALESRFITHETSGRELRKDIPINLPSTSEDEALVLRNKLLMYRFRNWGRYEPRSALVDRSLAPRINQMFVPLLSIIEDKNTCGELQGVMRDYHPG